MIIFNRILLGYILILLERSFVRKLHSCVCRCPLELVLEGNNLLYNVVLSSRLTEYFGVECCAIVKKWTFLILKFVLDYVAWTKILKVI